MCKSTFLSAKAWCIGMVMVACAAYGFSGYDDKQQVLNWSYQCLSQAYDASGDLKLRKWELSLTPDAFIRFRKIYLNGRQEYYSFNLRRFKDMDYLGNTHSGTLRIKTQTDDVIVQTYNDPKGNVDSMSTALKLPVRNMSAERLDSLLSALQYLKGVK